MMINFNGSLVPQEQLVFSTNERIISYADSIKELIRIVDGEIFLWEDHYFSLMASMRIMRMQIPLNFTPEFFQNQIKTLLQHNQNGCITFTCYRTTSSDILDSSIGYFIVFDQQQEAWNHEIEEAEIDVYKDFVINDSFFSQNNIVHPEENIARVYAHENDMRDLVLLNANKRIAKSLNGSIFLVNDHKIRTPKQSEGVQKSVLRNHFISTLNKGKVFEVEETEIFPFEMQRAEEIFVLIDGYGMVSYTKNRKKTYRTDKAQEIFSLFV